MNGYAVKLLQLGAIVGLLAIAVMIAACGQKGPLQLPNNSTTRIESTS